MNNFLLLLAGIAIGTYFAEQIRSTVPLSDPNQSIAPNLDGNTTTGGA